MKAFALAAAALLLLAGSAFADCPTLTGCLSCADDIYVCDSCNTAGGFIPDGLDGCTCDSEHHFAEDSTNPGSCICDPDNRWIPDAANPGSCACDVAAGFAQDPDVAAMCSCNAAKHFIEDVANPGTCICNYEKRWTSDPTTSGACVCDPGYAPNPNDATACMLSCTAAGTILNAAGTECVCAAGWEMNPTTMMCEVRQGSCLEGSIPVGNPPECISTTACIDGVAHCSTCDSTDPRICSVCDEASGWVLNGAVCECSGAGFTPIDDACVSNTACLVDPLLNCATDTSVTPNVDCFPENPNLCAACATGFTLNDQTHVCEADEPDTPLPCTDDRCDSDPTVGCPIDVAICVSCIPNFEPNDAGICVPVPLNCTAAHCTECVIDSATNTIIPDKCQVCAAGYEPNAQSACQLMPPPSQCTVDHCLACFTSQPTKCALCAAGFHTIPSGECEADVPNPPEPPTPTPPKPCTETFPGCARCDHDNDCVKCGRSNYVADLSLGRCRPARCNEVFRHCHKCSKHFRQCLVCERGFKKDRHGRCVRKTCKDLDQNCSTCDRRHPLKCQRCKNGCRKDRRGQCQRVKKH